MLLCTFCFFYQRIKTQTTEFQEPLRISDSSRSLTPNGFLQGNLAKESKFQSSFPTSDKDRVPKMATDTFEPLRLTSSEIDFFYKRRGETEESNIQISGLKINEEKFRVHESKDLPIKVSIFLPAEGIKVFNLYRTDFKSNQNFVWVGQGEESQWFNMHISYYNGYFAGSFNTEQGNYEISYLSEDKYALRKSNPHYYPMGCDETVFQEEFQRDQGSLEIQAPDGTLSDSTLYTISDKSKDGVDKVTLQRVVLDMVIGYSHLAEAVKGGPSPTKAFINLSFSEANTVHANSQTGVQLNLKDIIKLQMEPSKNLVLELSRLHRATKSLVAGDSNDVNNPYRVFANRKVQLNADLGYLFTEKVVDSCGEAYYAFNYTGSPNPFEVDFSKMLGVQSITCASYVLAHETGHNFRLYHNRPKTAHKHYGYGFRSNISGKYFRTIMSKKCPERYCPVILYYSTPLQKYKGLAIGEKDRIDAARYIRERSAFVRDLYPSTQSPRIIKHPQGGVVS